ncbi:MAG: hypothetical protein HZY76_16300 [Anaerolineae bacterium]|nr:MAG: hypothetical protein HZY76_16300 [Anaerolineae bacterium]
MPASNGQPATGMQEVDYVAGSGTTSNSDRRARVTGEELAEMGNIGRCELVEGEIIMLARQAGVMEI